MLVKATGAKNCLEVGMFTGFSTLSMAEALPEDGRVVSIELEPFFEEYNRRNAFDKSPHGHKIQVRIGMLLYLGDTDMLFSRRQAEKYGMKTY